MIALLPLVLSLAPELAKWLGGDTAGTVAAQAAEVVRTVTGTDDPVAAAAVLADPTKAADLRIRLAEIAAQREAAAAQAQMDTLRAGLADVASARARDTAIQASGGRNVRADVMVGLVIVGIVACLWFLRSGTFQPGSDVSGAVISVIGLLTKCFADAFQFEFGSSRGSADKSATISRALETGGAAQAPAAIATTGQVTVNEAPRAPSPAGMTADDLNRSMGGLQK